MRAYSGEYPAGLGAYGPLIRSERLIARGRVALVVFLFAILLIDVPANAAHARAMTALLAAYALFASLALAITWRARRLPDVFGTANQLTDLAAFGALAYITNLQAGPTVTVAAFLTLAAMVRWRWRGARWKVAAVLLVLAAVGALRLLTAPDRNLSPATYVIVLLNAILMVGLAVNFTALQDQPRVILRHLRGWIRGNPAELRPALEQALSGAARELRCPRLVLLWSESNSQALGIAEWADGALRTWTHPEEEFTPWVATELHTRNFLSWDEPSAEARVLYAGDVRLHEWRGQHTNAELVSRFRMHNVMSLRVGGEQFKGRLFALDNSTFTADDLTLGRAVAHRLTDVLGQVFLARKAQLAMTVNELSRFSRDVHDGVLQTLTATELELRRVELLVEMHPAEAALRLKEAQQHLSDEQRRLRFYVTGLRTSPLWLEERGVGLSAYLQDMTRRARAVWDLNVISSVDGVDQTLSSVELREMYRVIQEALANAARHGGASEVKLTVTGNDGRVLIVIEDNGRGFPFHGRYDHEALASMRLGPMTLRERVNELGGTLAIESNAEGARLEIEIPHSLKGA